MSVAPLRSLGVEPALAAKGGRLMEPDDPEPVPQGERHAGLEELDRLMAEGEREIAEQEADPQGGRFEEFDRLIEREFAEQKEDPKGERFLKEFDRLTAPSGRGQEKRRKGHRSRRKDCRQKAIPKPGFIPDDARIVAAKAEPDTFKALHSSGLLYAALKRYGWDAARVDDALDWLAPRFRQARPAWSATCGNSAELHRFLRKH